MNPTVLLENRIENRIEQSEERLSFSIMGNPVVAHPPSVLQKSFCMPEKSKILDVLNILKAILKDPKQR
jgi:hypothetical protein